MNRYLIPLIILTSLVTSSCASAVAQLPGTRNAWLNKWLSAPACQPPCWENIQPGKTSISEALTRLDQIPGVKFTYRSESSLEWIIDQTDSGWIGANNGLVDSIVLNIQRGEDVPLNELVNHYGTPSEAGVTSCEDGYCEVDLTYPTHTMVFELLLQNNPNVPGVVTVLSSSTIGRISFYKDIKAYWASASYLGGKFVNWKGYGDYP